MDMGESGMKHLILVEFWTIEYKLLKEAGCEYDVL